MLEVLEDTSLKKLQTIQHGFFTRQGGVSSKCYASLNCAYASKDDPNNVQENRRRAMSYFGQHLESLVSVRNFHSNHAVIVEQPWQEYQKPNADAMVTKHTQIILGSDSADCPIIIFADDEVGVIGLSHAGWRGAKSGIIEATVEKMILLGAKPHHITAAISPCISQNSYEVDFEFYQNFLEENVCNQSYFKNSNEINYFLFDILGYVKNRLQQLNLKMVSSEVAVNTYSDEKRFFSCRRAAHRGDQGFGGHLSCIYLK